MVGVKAWGGRDQGVVGVKRVVRVKGVVESRSGRVKGIGDGESQGVVWWGSRGGRSLGWGLWVRW